MSRPPFSTLPLAASGPPYNAWGLYGDKDALGALNLLTPARVASTAAAEIRTGERVSLDWPLNKPSHPSFNRPPFEVKRAVRKTPEGADRTANDDHLNFNTQCSSQWDGFRHYGYQKARQFYGGASAESLNDDSVIGIDAWAQHGGIVGRGVLLDYAAYCEEQAITTAPLESTTIPLHALQETARRQGVTFQPGDILFVRCGFTVAYDALTPEQQAALPQRPNPDFLGVEPTRPMLQWLWDSGFAAVASDAPSFERAPIAGAHTLPGGVWAGEAWEDDMQGGGLLHQVLLGGWGMPIGEMFDLEALAATCRRLGRWSFFVSSVPLKVPGGVASPPNAVAIF